MPAAPTRSRCATRSTSTFGPILFFAIVPGHEILDVEEVVARNPRFYVVRKYVAEAALARDTDPRS